MRSRRGVLTAPADGILSLIRRLPARCGQVTLVAIDGGAASGKTTLAERIGRSWTPSGILHTDDMLDGWDGQFGYFARLRDDVLTPLAEGKPAAYAGYNWLQGRFDHTIRLAVPRLLIVEGVGAAVACAGHASMAIVLEVPRSVREARWQQRDGPLTDTELRWLDREDAFFGENTPAAIAGRLDGPVVVLRHG